MAERNPNKDLPAEQVVHLFEKNLPHLLDGLTSDRSWLWYSGPKPSEEDRKTLLDLGFAFTGRPHECEDGRTAHWYHACGGIVYRRRSDRARTRHLEEDDNALSPDDPSAEHELAPEERIAAPVRTRPPSPAFQNLAALADVLP